MKNKKFLLLVLILTIVALTCVMALAACDETQDPHECESKCPTCGKCTNKDCTEEACKDKCPGHQQGGDDELLDYDMTGVTLSNKTVTYDGNEQKLEVAGTLPTGVAVAYEYFQGVTKLTAAPVNAGTYRVVAKFTGDSAHKPIANKEATLTIEKATYDMSGVTFANVTDKVYNGSAQTIEISGTLPTGVTVDYTYAQGQTVLTSAPVSAGTYTVTASFTGDSANYNAIDSKTATLVINKADVAGLLDELQLGATKDATGGKLYREVRNAGTLTQTGEIKKIEFTHKADGSFEAYLGEAVNNIYSTSYTIEALQSKVPVTLTFYTQVDGNNVVESSVMDEGVLSTLGETVYVLVSPQDTNYNSVLTSVTAVKRIVEIYNYDDLTLLSKDVYNLPVDVRLSAKYTLMNDIDCGGEVWEVIGTRLEHGTRDAYTLSFVSELDGNNKKISNYKITEDSVPRENIRDDAGIALGFFGFVSDAHVYDLTFENVVVRFNINKLADASKYGEDAYVWGQSNCWCYFGTVVGRLNVDNGYEKKNIFNNITVNGLDAVIELPFGFVGTFFGYDAGISPGHGGVTRENLNASNVKIVLYQALYMSYQGLGSFDTLFLGGFVGRMQTYNTVTYKDCSIDEITLVLDRDLQGYESQPNVYYEGYLGAFAAHHGFDVNSAQVDKFQNCTIDGLEIINKSGAPTEDLGIAEGKGYKPGLTALQSAAREWGGAYPLAFEGCKVNETKQKTMRAYCRAGENLWSVTYNYGTQVWDPIGEDKTQALLQEFNDTYDNLWKFPDEEDDQN